MTNREAHEKAAGMGLCNEFFAVSGIDPDAEYKEAQQEAVEDLQTATNFEAVAVVAAREIKESSQKSYNRQNTPCSDCEKLSKNRPSFCDGCYFTSRD